MITTANNKRALCALVMVVIASSATTGHAMGTLHEAAASGNTQFVNARTLLCQTLKLKTLMITEQDDSHIAFAEAVDPCMDQ
jgi:hypothetical protein